MSAAVESLGKRGAIYKRLGIKPIISAIGTVTTVSGSIMEPEVVQAMVDASHVMVKMQELNECAGELIAKYTHAEAGLVTAGAADAMLLQAAACIAGKDQAKIKRLPDTEGMKNEFIISLKHEENPYVQLWRGAGAKMVWVGSSSGGRVGPAVGGVLRRRERAPEVRREERHVGTGGGGRGGRCRTLHLDAR